jgi:hypothetical protein
VGNRTILALTKSKKQVKIAFDEEIMKWLAELIQIRGYHFLPRQQQNYQSQIKNLENCIGIKENQHLAGGCCRLLALPAMAGGESICSRTNIQGLLQRFKETTQLGNGSSK